MSELSTTSTHADQSNEELVQLIPSPVVPSDLTVSKLVGQRSYPSINDNKDKTSYYAVGREIYDTYSDSDDEASVEETLDFGRFKVPGQEEHIESLHKIYDVKVWTAA